MNRPDRVEICGGIASGKTTLASALGAEFPISLEAFEANPFWRAFYDDPAGNAFEAEITFLLQHYHDVKHRGRSTLGVLVCDYALLLDRAYALTTLAAEELPAFLSVYSVVTKRLPPPTLVVHLRCDPAEEHTRIAQRGRQVERTATLDFLARLNGAIEEELAAPGLDVSILRIDSDRLNFTERGADREQVVTEVGDAIRRATASA